MKKVTIVINTINAAFEYDVYEIRKILSDLSGRIGRDGEITNQSILDSNGNTVGKLTVR